MNKADHVYVYLGRFAPFHLGHQMQMEMMISRFGLENCLIMVGSSDSHNSRTPFSYEDRERMIKAVFPKIKIIPLPDVNPAIEHFDSNTNDIWLDRLEKIEGEMSTRFIFLGGCREDLSILAGRFETEILMNRNTAENHGSASEVRTALENHDKNMLEKRLDPRVLQKVVDSYMKYKKSSEESIRISLAQIEVAPGRPDINTAKIISKIDEAKKDGVDLILFSEMVVSGYLLGDEWENEGFVKDLLRYNEDIRKASKEIGVIWGNVYAEFDKKGEDGRPRKFNAVYLAQDGKWVNNGVFEGHTFKTLMPKYREFDDERHFYSMLKLANDQKTNLGSLLKPFEFQVRGKSIKVGAILCEDMWCDDYTDNPTETLVKNGAEIIVNLSCSPWTWRKNDKRHRVVKSLLEKNPVPFLYCNNVGIQNNGKNIFLFDGNSTVYDRSGKIVKQAEDYKEETVGVEMLKDGVRSLDFARDDAKDSGNDPTSPPPLHLSSAGQGLRGAGELSKERDTQELYEGLVYGLKKFFEGNNFKTAVLGLSGGVDSAVSACLLAKAIGPENVFAVNMPSKFNSDLTKNAAFELAKNLGINYAILPIQDSVDLTVKQFEGLTLCKVNNNSSIGDCFGSANAETRNDESITLEVSGYTLENIQARDRGSRVLAGIAACLGGIFTNNGNKTETTIGWCTLYGDVNGAIAPIADIYKAEVYQLANYINERAGKKIIPAEILDVIPSAELSAEQDVTKGKGDPILYPYHDKLFRAFVEFRRDPEYILDLYIKGTMEKELMIDDGLVAKYFPTKQEFVADLEHKWKMYKGNIFKRIQAPPIIAVSRRAFGFDLRETQNGAYFTRGYLEMKRKLLGK